MAKKPLGLYINESKSAKQWLLVLNNLKTRGVKKVYVSCSDNLKGILKSINSAFPESKMCYSSKLLKILILE